MAIEAMDGAVWEWDEKSEKIYISNMMTSLLSLDSNYLDRRRVVQVYSRRR